MNIAEHAERIGTLLDEQGPDAAYEAAVELLPSLAGDVLATLIATRPGAERIPLPSDLGKNVEWRSVVAGVIFHLTPEGLAAKALKDHVDLMCGELISLRQGKRRSERASFDAVMEGRVADTSKYLPQGASPEGVEAAIRIRAEKLAITAACVDPESSMADIVMAVAREAERDGKAQRGDDGLVSVEATTTSEELIRHARSLETLFRDRFSEVGLDLAKDDALFAMYRLGVSLALGIVVHGPAENRRRAAKTLALVIGLERG